ncbi:protein serine-threonine phosphatase [Cystobacter fuscus DSM 2262]|uniref:Protein serine-threonine phosphatase n=1 Tax=Cystobacter fuscus (strain ATCC 25194 / DSM 2262 / NBRC 100088 / M29) TaxID=1242864 RepID=S9PJI9_CYSF2|nr:polynucleotide kinase-phosphatase [Cystobacter fuscus]EPX62572.1 protein serine-threonine phosphatase [Cystobacter fuscus DSM 2262]
MKTTIPELALVVLIGPSGSGKSSFARKHFLPTEVLSSDAYRGLVSDDELNQDSTADAFEALRFVAAKRLARGRLTVIDATNVQPESRKFLVELAREYHVLPVAVVLDVPEKICHERNRLRPDRNMGSHVVRTQLQQLHRSIRGLEREGFRHVHVLEPERIEAFQLERQPLWNNRKHDTGPFDIIGDIHGCLDELTRLLTRLGYEVSPKSDGTPGFDVRAPTGRKAVFLGDLVDRGPDIPGVLRLVMGMVEAGSALCVPGNHEIKLMRKLRGKDVKVSHGLAQSLEQLEREPPEFRASVASFIDDLVSHYVLDGGRLVVAHAGMKESMQGRGSGKVRDFALYGETTGETDEYGIPVRHDWAAEYRGKAMVVYGHTAVLEAEWLNNTLCVDTGCVYGGKLTALRYPEREIVSVPAARVYCEPTRPLVPPAAAPGLSAQQQHDDVLDLADVSGKRLVTTRLMHNVTLREENTAAALEAMSRFAIDPRWLIYLPPTMSPSETSSVEGLLEHPSEAFGYYRKEGVARVICEEKHMGSRSVVIVCRDAEAARRRFGVGTGETGVCYTRTGRRFFSDEGLEAAFLARVRAALDATGFWETFHTEWACLDCELMPWSLKAQELLRNQYAAVGAASRAALSDVVGVLGQAAARGLDVGGLSARFQEKQRDVGLYVDAYRRYCWPVRSLEDVRLAPFHLLATEGAVHVDKDHVWHMETLARVCRADERFLLATPYQVIDLADARAVEEGVRWWDALTGRGGEGMVVKPLAFTARGRKGLLQPAIKSRGPEYLRIIYGPEYTAADNLERLRQRGLSTKRSMALREFALGVEGLERFVRQEPLRRVHECVFGVLALESEPVDPRL